MKRFLFFNLFLLGSFFFTHAEIYNTSGISIDWSNPLAWENELVPPSTLQSDDVININHRLIISVNLVNNGTMNFNAGLVEYISTTSSLIFSNYGAINMYGNFNNYEILLNGNTGIIQIYGTASNMAGIINNDGVMHLNTVGTWLNYFYINENGITKCKPGILNNNNEFVNHSGTIPAYGCGIHNGNDIVVASAIEEELANQFTLFEVYPNPFSSDAILALSAKKDSQAQIKLFDLLGREVGFIFQGLLHTEPTEIPLTGSHLAKGAYLLRVQTNTAVLSKIVYIR